MTKKYLVSLILMSTALSFSQSPNYEWAKNIFGLKHEEINSVVADDFGNVFVGGYFSSVTATFDSTNVSNTSSSGNTDGFLTKFDSNGMVVWTKSITGTSSESIAAIDVDLQGNIYVCGSFSSNPTTVGGLALTPLGVGELFLAKYDTNGTVVWVKKFGGINSGTVSAIDVSDWGKISILGSFNGGSITIESTVLTNTNSGYADVYVAQYDLDGNFLWSKKIGGMAAEEPQSIKIDNNGNTLASLNFSSQSILVDNLTLTNSSNLQNGFSYYGDFAIIKYDTNGEVIWANRFGGNDSDTITSISLDSSNSLFISGRFLSSNLNMGSTTLNSNSGEMFNVKLTPNGDLVWARNTGSSSFVSTNLVDSDGNLYICGSFFGSAIFDGITVNAASLLNATMFISKLNSVGVCQWVKSSSYINYISSSAKKRIALNNLGDLFFAGIYNSSTITLDSFTLSNSNSFLNSFLTKINHTSLEKEDFDEKEISIFPNPTNGILNLSNFNFSDTNYYSIIDMTGRIIKSKTFLFDDKINVSDLKNGVYLLNYNDSTYKFLKQ